MVIEVEITRETRARVLALLPRAINLRLAQIGQAALADRMPAKTSGLQSQDGPGCLRGRTATVPCVGAILVRAACFAPAAIGVLALEQAVCCSLDLIPGLVP